MIAWLRHRSEELRVGVMFLTRLPMGRIARQLPLSQTSWTWPLVGAWVGLIFAGVIAMAQALGLPSQAAIVIAMGAGLLLTGGLHEDGLADLADGVGGGGTPARRLDIMRDSRIGSYGTLALILVLGLQATLWQSLDTEKLLPSAIACGALSRAALPLWMQLYPNARAQGLGQTATIGMTPLSTLIAVALGLAISCTIFTPLPGLIVLAAVIFAQVVVCSYAKSKLGGITGDVMGAAQVLGQTTGLAALVAVLTP